MASCTFGTQPKTGSGDWAWFTWTAFLSWLVLHYNRLGSLVWLWHPDTLLNVADLCSTEVAIPAFPSILEWVGAFNGNPANALVVGNYLRQLYIAALWDTYCECTPGGGSGYDTAVLANSPQVYWKMDDAASPLTDSSGHGRSSGAIGAGTFHTAGPWSGAFSYTPPAGFTGPATSATFTPQDSTAEAWFKLDHLPAGGSVDYFISLAAAGNGWNAFIDSAGKIGAISQGAGTWTCSTCPVFAADGRWHYLAVTVDSADFGYFNIDGGATIGIGSTGAFGGASTFGFGAFAQNPRSRLALYKPALSLSAINAHYAAAGGSPIYTPPTPADPTDIPDNPTASCTTTADLCTAVNKVLAAVTNTSQAINWLQAATAPTCWVPGTPVVGVTGTGTLVVSDIVGAYVSITVPTTWGRTFETPPRYVPELGSIQFNTDGVASQRIGLHYASENILGANVSSNSIRYSLKGGVSATITPLQRCK